MIDHIYLKDPTEISNLTCLTPPFGDHTLVHFEINIKNTINITSILPFSTDVIKTLNGITWNGKDWAHNCSFNGSDIISLSLDKDQCAINCSVIQGKTPFNH